MSAKRDLTKDLPILAALAAEAEAVYRSLAALPESGWLHRLWQGLGRALLVRADGLLECSYLSPWRLGRLLRDRRQEARELRRLARGVRPAEGRQR